MKFFHMIPKDGIGGVEHAARSLVVKNDLDITTVFLCGNLLTNKQHITSISPDCKLNSFGFYFNGIRFLCKQQPDILLCSLWRSSIVGLTYLLLSKIGFKPKVKLITFLHSSKFGHFFEKIISKAAIKFSHEVWCDSQATKLSIVEFVPEHKSHVISFFVKLDSFYSESNLERHNNFVFWGRLAKVKRVDKAIILFHKLSATNENSIFYIYGPDCGELQNLQNLVSELNLNGKVLFMGPKEPNKYSKEILTAKFFFNTSDHEGMAMSVVEAMQLGLVPIVTPVGEIANYCHHNHNSIYYDNDAYNLVVNAISNRDVYDSLKLNAINCWADTKDYSQDFNDNVIRVFGNV
ncbi:glycosyltransferase [Rheinheimera metallidurans]|uniref:glycosyltransferase family 4 protein n=1 Tax=Rheinheimera metallidurans TaxID=2925781 RepID=UPI0030033DF6